MFVWFVGQITSAPLARADEADRRWNLAGWTPSLSLALGVHAAPVSGFVNATKEGIGAAEENIRLPEDDRNIAITPISRISLGLETPELPGRIRLFGTVDYFVAFPPDLKIATESSPTGFFVPPGFQNPPVAAIEGQGSQTSLKMNRSAYGVTGGISIPVSIGDFRFHVKPGVSWMEQEWKIRGVMIHAEKSGFVGSRDFRGVVLRGRGKLRSSGVGPYLAIETEPDPWGPVLVSAFFDAAYYRTLGDRDEEITESTTLSGDFLPTETYTARWGLGLDKYFWRAGIGIRVFLAVD
ncbi:MAG TPA: hypothetical protein EYG08_10290 [Myxococcales bacterium]|nr:hypothetical protein [Myxococcales bacterium]